MLVAKAATALAAEAQEQSQEDPGVTSLILQVGRVWQLTQAEQKKYRQNLQSR